MQATVTSDKEKEVQQDILLSHQVVATWKCLLIAQTHRKLHFLIYAWPLTLEYPYANMDKIKFIETIYFFRNASNSTEIH